MAKDPAFLFYPSDFLTGTMFMTDEQIGKYMKLLCAQHQHGHLTENHMISVCKSRDPIIWEKFEQLEDGKYHNKRLHDEILKRQEYCISRSHKGLSGRKKLNHTKTIRKSYGNHTEDRNRNVIGSEIEYVNEQEKELINSFLEYRKEINKPYKSDRSIKAMVERLRKLGNNNIETMKEIVQLSIASGYEGLFALKKDKEYKPKFGRQEVTRESLVAQAERLKEKGII